MPTEYQQILNIQHKHNTTTTCHNRNTCTIVKEQRLEGEGRNLTWTTRVAWEIGTLGVLRAPAEPSAHCLGFVWHYSVNYWPESVI